MKQHTLYIEMNPSSEVMERVLRVTRHRGFAVATLQLNQSQQGSHLQVTVNSDRPIDQLTRQLDKLIDVNTCRLATSANHVPTNSAVATAAAHG
ncbi:acetolactate synthase 2 small subunit [uncultured Ferrimonas sp.]|uniref:acetolactate synthase 2 small subunit n=1 Tax=uncultured Ferrimonas sp. TaxID=432640 RepID=UPI0026072C6D|nr:acetolactate synthase 2 small subunit [uncultured Ferrimonas sp.]